MGIVPNLMIDWDNKMDEYRIKCRNRDTQERLISVGIGSKTFTVEQVWEWIENKTYGFYTFENNHKAIVRTGVSKTGRKYITTNPDGVTENNLDELGDCQ